MSYEIIYSKQFIKLSDGRYVPMLYWGSNNCYESTRNGKDRRSRSWSDFHSLKVSTEKEMMDWLDNYRNELIQENSGQVTASGYQTDVYSDDSFSYFSSIQISGKPQTSFQHFKGLFKSGIKNAATIDEIKKHVSIYVSVWDKDNKNERILINTEEQLLSTLQGEGQRFVCFSDSDYLERNIKFDRYGYSPKKQRQFNPSEYYILETNMGFVCGMRKYGYSYSSGKWNAKKYANMKSAERAKQAIINKLANIDTEKIKIHFIQNNA